MVVCGPSVFSAVGIVESSQEVMMFWKNDRSQYGYVVREKVQMYECQFTCATQDSVQRRQNVRCLVVSNTVEEAIAACRERWPNDFVLTGVHKRNQQCDLIVVDSVIPIADKE